MVTSHSSGPFYDKSAHGAWTYAKEPGQWIPWTPSSPVRGASTPAGKSLWHINSKTLKNCEILPITLSLTKPFILSRYLIKTGRISQRRQKASSQVDFGASFSIPHIFCVPYFSSKRIEVLLHSKIQWKLQRLLDNLRLSEGISKAMCVLKYPAFYLTVPVIGHVRRVGVGARRETGKKTKGRV